MSKWYVFLFLILLSSCHSNQSKQPISIVWEGGKPVGLNIPNSVFPDKYTTGEIRVYVADNQSNRPVLGSLQQTDSSVIFQTLIPLTYEVTYRITYKHLVVEETRIFEPVVKDKPELLNVYPSADTVPENLLKFYFQFSHTMSQEHSLQYIFLINEKGDTLQPFLDLPNELWNGDRTLLTLWLDPGRIKRELVPNRELGSPLTGNYSYRLIVSDQWNDNRGHALKSPFEKLFYVAKRDDTKPNSKNWIINSPAVGSQQDLRISFHEPLDYGLLQECFAIKSDKGKFVGGEWAVNKNEREIAFRPAEIWESGNYQIQMQAKLEDLAGNNLKRLFDEEIKKAHQIEEEPLLSIDFNVSE